jgi:hypothetical protein
MLTHDVRMRGERRQVYCFAPDRYAAAAIRYRVTTGLLPARYFHPLAFRLIITSGREMAALKEKGHHEEFPRDSRQSLCRTLRVILAGICVTRQLRARGNRALGEAKEDLR